MRHDHTPASTCDTCALLLAETAGDISYTTFVANSDIGAFWEELVADANGVDGEGVVFPNLVTRERALELHMTFSVVAAMVDEPAKDGIVLDLTL